MTKGSNNAADLGDIVFPIHFPSTPGHWACGRINIPARVFQYFDSYRHNIATREKEVQSSIRDFLRDLSNQVLGHDIELGGWKFSTPEVSGCLAFSNIDGLKL